MTLSRKLILALVLLVASLSPALAQECRLGLEWRISSSQSWGNARPVVLAVDPYSPAARAELRAGDIIERIDGYATSGLTSAQVEELLHSPQQHHLLTVSRHGASSRQVLLTPECQPYGSITERSLAEILRGYSPEDASLLVIDYPFSYVYNETIDLARVSTFALAKSDPTSDIDRALDEELRTVLTEHGLRESAVKPDLVFSTYYQLDPLPTAPATEGAGQSWRYAPQTRSLHVLPIVDSLHADARYRLVLGVQAHRPGATSLVWSCEAREWLSRGMTIEDYGRYALVPMLSGFPLVSRPAHPRLEVHALRYHYTGLVFSRSDLGHLASVDDDSPAMRVGLRAGDRIRSINGVRLTDTTPAAFLQDYARTLEDLAAYRDDNLPRLSGISVWRADAYLEVAERLRAEPLSYLFGFRSYVSPGRAEAITIEIERNGRRHTVQVKPELRTETTLTPR